MQHLAFIARQLTNISSNFDLIFAEMLDLRQKISSIEEKINFFESQLNKLKQNLEQAAQYCAETGQEQQKSGSFSTHFQQFSTHKFPVEHTQNNSAKFDRITPYFSSSTGNEGVSTLRQHFDNTSTSSHKMLNRTSPEVKNEEQFTQQIASFVEEMKKRLKHKFKLLTRQEFNVFSAIYTIVNEKQYATYKDIAKMLNLTPSSVRDYVNRLVEKGIPIIKQRHNNKLVLLSLPTELMQLATLEAITKLYNSKLFQPTDFSTEKQKQNMLNQQFVKPNN